MAKCMQCDLLIIVFFTVNCMFHAFPFWVQNCAVDV